jgi:hypothetical protein
LLNKVVGHNIMELKINHIPRGLVPLEILFDSNYVSREATIKNQEEEVVECNIGTTEKYQNSQTIQGTSFTPKG